MKKFVAIVFFSGMPLLMPQLALAHSAITSNQAWEVCENLEKSAACEYTNDHKDIYRGTCQLMSQKLMCVRNQPIEKAEPEKTKP